MAVDIPATSDAIPGTLVLRDSTGRANFNAVAGTVITATSNVGGNAATSFAARATGTASGQRAGISFNPTFFNFPGDTAPRRAADIWAGFTGTWGTQYMSFGVGSAQNDVSDETPERVRIKAGGQVRFIPLAADPAGAEAGDVYYNSGTNKLRIYNGTSWENSSGALGPFFRAFAGTSTVLSSAGVTTVVNLNSESFDPSNVFASSRFTPNVAGYYFISGTLVFGSLAAVTKAKASILKNGVIVADGNEATGWRFTVSDIVYMNGTTDYIELGATHNDSVNRSVNSGSANTYLSGYFIRA